MKSKSGSVIKKALCVVITAVLLISIGCPIYSIAENKTVRVGFMDYKGFIEQNSDDTFIGYGAEYLAEISKYTDYKYEYVQGEWSDLLQMLEDRSIDLLCTAQYTEQRAEIYDFSYAPIGYTQGFLYTTPDNQELCYEDFLMFNGINVGILKGSAMRELFVKYESLHNFSCNLSEYDNDTAMLEALGSGEIDAFCTESLSYHSDLLLLANFGADAFYIMSYKNNPFMDDIDFALQQIKTDVDFEATLHHKYYDSSSAESTLRFTSAEREFINQSGVIRVGLNTNREPFSLYDENTGTFTGICVDILEQISKRSGLTFELIPQEAGATTVDLLAGDNFDVICGIERDNFLTNTTILSTDSFLESQIVPVGRKDADVDINGDLNVAIPSSFAALRKSLELNYPNLNLTFYKTNRECLDAVVNGEADLFIQNTHIIGKLIQEPKYDEIKMLPIEIMTEHTAMALLRTADPLLVSILNKTISSIDDATINSSLIEHTFATPYKYTFSDMLYKFRIQIIIISFLMLACFALLLFIIYLRRRSELKLQKKNELLADAVAQADRASVAKSEFLSRMSHEIRTPMNAIVGLTEIAKQYEENAQKIDDYLNKIELSSKVLLNIINDVLDMSAIESNKLKIAKSEFDIKQVLTGISTIYYPQCKSKGIDFYMATDLENEYLIGDSLRVNQILMNLVSNSYKFTENGGSIKILVKETARKDNKSFIRFTVTDTGCGMSPEMLNRLFKPFEQETGDTAKKHGGSGLGLSIAKNLTDLMHGAINVESEKGKGTTFFVDLPFEISKNSNRPVSDETLASIRVLTVDDDASAREYTSIVLKRIGVSFDIASSGKQALEMLKEAKYEGNPYNVCLIDWKMPDMDGLEVTKSIRKQENEKSLIIIATAYDLNEIEDKAKDIGADYFVSKPLFQSTVFNVLMTLTNGRAGVKSIAKSNYDLTGHRLLLAEDNDLNAEIAIELLKNIKIDVERAADGQQAVDMFKNNAVGTYDLILMDVQMPKLNGYEATQAIRSLERTDAKEIPIFAMTANAFTEDVAAAFSAGMNGHIAKPIDTKQLYKTVYEAIVGKE